MAQIGLFGPSYILDTSSLVDIQFEDNPTKVWDGIYDLIAQGRIKTVNYVFDELDKMVDDKKILQKDVTRFKEQKHSIVIPDTEIIVLTGEINYKYPNLGKALSKHNRADPWLVAAGKAKGYIVVTEERDTGPGMKRRIPWVCEQEGVVWCRLRHLIQNERLLE